MTHEIRRQAGQEARKRPGSVNALLSLPVKAWPGCNTGG